MSTAQGDCWLKCLVLPAFCPSRRQCLLGIFAYQVPSETGKPAKADEPCSELNGISARRQPMDQHRNQQSATAPMQDHGDARTSSISECAVSVWFCPTIAGCGRLSDTDAPAATRHPPHRHAATARSAQCRLHFRQEVIEMVESEGVRILRRSPRKGRVGVLGRNILGSRELSGSTPKYLTGHLNIEFQAPLPTSSVRSSRHRQQPHQQNPRTVGSQQFDACLGRQKENTSLAC